MNGSHKYGSSDTSTSNVFIVLCACYTLPFDDVVIYAIVPTGLTLSCRSHYRALNAINANTRNPSLAKLIWPHIINHLRILSIAQFYWESHLTSEVANRLIKHMNLFIGAFHTISSHIKSLANLIISLPVQSSTTVQWRYHSIHLRSNNVWLNALVVIKLKSWHAIKANKCELGLASGNCFVASSIW